MIFKLNTFFRAIETTSQASEFYNDNDDDDDDENRKSKNIHEDGKEEKNEKKEEEEEEEEQLNSTQKTEDIENVDVHREYFDCDDDDDEDDEQGHFMKLDTNEDLLKDFDLIPSTPENWIELLQQKHILFPEYRWITISVSFEFKINEQNSIGVPIGYNLLEITDSSYNMSDLFPIETDTREIWITKANLNNLECIPDSTEKCSTVWTSINFEGYGTEVVARSRINSSEVFAGDIDLNLCRSSYHIPLQNLLEPKNLKAAERNQLAIMFARNKNEDYFKGLATPLEEHPDWYRVKRELPLVCCMMLWVEHEQRWMRDAVYRPDDDFIIVPKIWYDNFCQYMGVWLKTWKLETIPFRLRLKNPAKTSCVYYAEILAKCVFVDEDKSESED